MELELLQTKIGHIRCSNFEFPQKIGTNCENDQFSGSIHFAVPLMERIWHDKDYSSRIIFPDFTQNNKQKLNFIIYFQGPRWQFEVGGLEIFFQRITGGDFLKITVNKKW